MIVSLALPRVLRILCSSVVILSLSRMIWCTTIILRRKLVFCPCSTSMAVTLVGPQDNISFNISRHPACSSFVTRQGFYGRQVSSLKNAWVPVHDTSNRSCHLDSLKHLNISLNNYWIFKHLSSSIIFKHSNIHLKHSRRFKHVFALHGQYLHPQLQSHLSLHIAMLRYGPDKMFNICPKILTYLIVLTNFYFYQWRYNLMIILFVKVRVSFNAGYHNLLLQIPIWTYGFIDVSLVIIQIQYFITSNLTDPLPYGVTPYRSNTIFRDLIYIQYIIYYLKWPSVYCTTSYIFLWPCTT